MKVSLEHLNTFSVKNKAEKVFFFNSLEELIQIYQDKNNHPILILGQGSNVLFTEDFKGSVLVNKIKGFDVKEDEFYYYIELGSGENWHETVTKTLDLSIYGLENLALIPGNVGSAPIQNIGAYGSEFKNFCNFIDILDFTTFKVKRLSVDECQFAYRNSIFKHKYKNACIIKVGLKLAKKWQPNLSYAPLNN